MKNKQVAIGTYLLDKLHSLGVNHIFGIPGDYILKFNKQIEQHEKITFIGATRENTAGYMADAYARMNGLGAVCITYGVGINIVNATAQAFVESVPLVIISGAVSSTEYQKCHTLHHLINGSVNDLRDLTQYELFKNITVAQGIITDIHTAETEINRVLSECLKQKKPVYIELPRNMIDREINLKDHSDLNTNPLEDESLNYEDALKETKKVLENCSKPLLWIGHEISRHHLSEDLLTFARNNQIPIASTILGKTAISEKDSLFLGIYQGELSRKEVKDYVESADCIITLGAILTDMDTGIFTTKHNHRYHIFVNKNSFVIQNIHYKNLHFEDYIRKLKDLCLEKPFDKNFSAASCRKKEPYQALPQKITSEKTFKILEDHLSSNHIIITDIGDCLFGAIDFVLDQNSFLACVYFATLGYCVPAAVATQLTKLEKRVIGIVGDGAFQMTCNELSTAIKHGICPIIIVLNNHGYGTERPIIEGNYNDILDWDYTALTKVFRGGIGIEVSTEMEFEQALIKALGDKEQLYLIEVELDKTDFSPALKNFLALASRVN